MDDEGTGKARRNLLLVSSVVVLGAWLELPLPGVVARVLGIDHGAEINEARLWAAMLAVLAYLVYRFTYSEDAGASAATVRDSWAALCQAKAEALLRGHLSRSVAKGRDSQHFDNLLIEFLEANARSLDIDRTKGGRLELCDVEIVFESPWRGAASVSVHGVDRSGAQRARGIVRIPFIVTETGKRLQIELPAAIELALRSNATSTTFVPAAMALLAVLIAAYKLTTALL